MYTIFLLDGSVKTFEFLPTGKDVAEAIASSLAKKAIAVKANGNLQDLNLPLENNAKIEIVTAESSDGLEIIRHDTAHILAHAVKELFPETQITIGPNIENGFFYDFARAHPFDEKDFEAIEKKMQ